MEGWECSNHIVVNAIDESLLLSVRLHLVELLPLGATQEDLVLLDDVCLVVDVGVELTPVLLWDIE